MRIVFDTNVYVSAFVVPGSKSELAFSLAARHLFDLMVSLEILTELEDKLISKFGFPQETVQRVRREVGEIATIVEPELRITMLDDDPDNRILECAVASGAVAMVTGDRHLLKLGHYEGIGIMTVAELLYSFPS